MRHRYSGASFALLHPTNAPENARVSVVRNWKGELPGNTTSNKVPTLIAYDDDGKAYWGFDIPSKVDDDKIKWLKLLLEPGIHIQEIFNDTDNIDCRLSRRTLERLHRHTIETASEYVKLLWEHVKAQIISEISQATYNFAEKSVVFSVPAVWSETAKHNTYLVAAGAGLASEDLNLQTISEPEAAAMAVLKERGPFLKVRPQKVAEVS
jgi:molecular chaperone DnaK (HSP70)